MILKQRRTFIILTLLFCLIYILLACYKITSPGVQYDELLFVNAASEERVDNSFIFKEIAGVPVLLMHYIGALKSYIYYPIFKLFGVNVWSIRLPVILITFLSLLLISRISYKVFNWQLSLLILFFLIIDPSFIYMTRLDVGPNVFELFLKCASLFLFYRYFVEGRSNYYLVIGLLLLGLGLFNKLNFIWFINAIYGTTIIINVKKIKKTIIENNKRLLFAYWLIIVAFFIYLGYFLFVYYHIPLSNLGNHDYGMHTIIVIDKITDLFNGSIFYKYIYVAGTFKNTF